MRERTVARCVCGGVELEMSGAPILSSACYCDDCQEGARQIQALPNAAAVQDADAGTAYVLYRKDRVTVSQGEPLLKRYKIRVKSPTNRVVATCCNSAMMVNFDDGKWWVDVYCGAHSRRCPARAGARLYEIPAWAQRSRERRAELSRLSVQIDRETSRQQGRHDARAVDRAPAAGASGLWKRDHIQSPD